MLNLLNFAKYFVGENSFLAMHARSPYIITIPKRSGTKFFESRSKKVSSSEGYTLSYTSYTYLVALLKDRLFLGFFVY